MFQSAGIKGRVLQFNCFLILHQKHYVLLGNEEKLRVTDFVWLRIDPSGKRNAFHNSETLKSKHFEQVF